MGLLPIEEVTIKLAAPSERKVVAYGSLVIAGVAVHDIRLINSDGRGIVSMPSRALDYRCSGCGEKNKLTAKYCNRCGVKLDEPAVSRDASGRMVLHADVVHPIRHAVRRGIEDALWSAYEAQSGAPSPGG